MNAEQNAKRQKQAAKAAWFKATLENPWMQELFEDMTQAIEKKKKGLNPIDNHDELCRLYLHECGLKTWIHNMKNIAGSGEAIKRMLEAENAEMTSPIARFNKLRSG